MSFSASDLKQRLKWTKVGTDQTIRFFEAKFLRIVIHVPRVFDPVQLIKAAMAVAVVDAPQNGSGPKIPDELFHSLPLVGIARGVPAILR